MKATLDYQYEPQTLQAKNPKPKHSRRRNEAVSLSYQEMSGDAGLLGLK